MKESEGPQNRPEEPGTDDQRLYAVDELNLAEFPLAGISDRFLDGTKTVVFQDTVWDCKKKQRLPRHLTLSGSDRYGLPSAKDDDVLLGCIQISSLGDFANREVHFSRYELLKLLRWKDQTRNYRRLSASLRRWKGLTVFSNRAFYDKSRQSWVNKDFGVFDNLYVYHRETEEGRRAPASSWFVWNEVLFSSFQTGYLKRLDWGLYCRLESAVAKRLYRFLDKRFYHSHRVEIDLEELAFRKVRISQGYNTAQIKRVLLKGIHELESKWELKPLEESQRFRKEGRGKWTAVLLRRRRRPKRGPIVVLDDPSSLEVELTRRGIGPAVAEELVAAHLREDIQKMSELFDWYNSHGQERGPGFLVEAIKNPKRISTPRGFESSSDREARQRAAAAQKRDALETSRRREKAQEAAESARQAPFWAFWGQLDDEQRQLFEKQAVANTDRIKRQGYDRSMGREELVFEKYRQTILLEHFARVRPAAINS